MPSIGDSASHDHTAQEESLRDTPAPYRELNNKFDDLDRAMQIAAKCRFKASRRQRSHKQIAQGTIALLSLELIIVPTLLLGGLKTEFSPEMTAAIQICAAAFVLVYSLLIGGGEYSLKEHRHHESIDRVES
jgi:SMODS and SLOG-associating 2TM effector domain family 5